MSFRIYLTSYSWSSDVHCIDFGGNYFYFSILNHSNLHYSKQYSVFVRKIYQLTYFIHPVFNLIFIDIVFLLTIIFNYRLFSKCSTVYFQYYQTLFSIFIVKKFLKKNTQVWFGSLPNEHTSFDKFVLNFTLRYCHEALVESEYLSNRLSHDFKKIIGTKVNVDVSLNYKMNKFRPIDYILVGFPGKTKGIIDFLECIEKSNQKSILIISDIDIISIEEYLIIKHRINSENLHFLFSFANCYINVSPSEGGPRTMVEAYMCGCKVKSLKNSVAPDMIKEGCEGIEVYDNINELIKSL